MAPEQTGQLSQELQSVETRHRIVELAKQGHSLRSIASQMGFASSNAVSHHLAAYRAALTPSSELAEEWRQTRLARADERFRRLAPLALADPPDLGVLAALQREEESITKMLGANLELGVSFLAVTREALAGALWAADDVIDGEATEVTDG